jgi:hypothetical protein
MSLRHAVEQAEGCLALLVLMVVIIAWLCSQSEDKTPPRQQTTQQIQQLDNDR